MYIIKKAKQIIEENFHTIQCLEEISEKTSCNYHTLRRKFVKKTGYTLGEYLNLVRCRAAKEYIQYTDYKISYIALKVGYNDEMYFCKIFKKIYGKCPTEFRKE